MFYLLILIVLFATEIIYFKVADRFNIIDKPNQRSSHSTVTLRGGGVIFYVAILAYFLAFDFTYPWFFIGLTMITLISFLDDIFTLSNKIRLVVHFTSVLLMAYELDLFTMPWYFLLIGFIITVGVINAYNFMDGINGITAAYSLSIIALLWLVNQQISFIASDFLIFITMGVLVFTFFNFRTKAKCFAGDVGSVAIAYILMFVIGLLIIVTKKPIYILFLSVYGLDSVWTIIRRLYLRENIFEAHRSHLYQYLSNEGGINKLVVASAYAVLQFIIGLVAIVFSKCTIAEQLLVTITLLISMSVVYLLIKKYFIKRFVKY
ncbi:MULTISPECIES: MraY family glycosyltransferase [unclassified Sphingobacterium]|uniref:MraY family glycosyltransferase n=1 Tax=unclassified Sphingobacterium TaxID=2609468 RepID=UPI0025F7E307|nr:MULTISPECIES: glycosyltransferase family 4 protein [unclassified Sphingobacterium]